MTEKMKNSFIASQSKSIVVYDSFSGIPLRVTFLGNSWWVTSPREKLQPLEKYFDCEDISFCYLCEAGGTVGALALARMLGYALENPEDDVSDVMHRRVAELNRLGVSFDLWDEPLLLELDVLPNGQNSRREGKFSVMCYAKGACNECLFNIDGFDSKADAEGRAMFYFDFLDYVGIRYTIF
jgi:hypothetical protein